MKFKKYIKPHDFDRIILVCWFILGLLWLYTILTGNYFYIVINNPYLISIGNYIDNSIFLYVIKYIMYTLNSIFVVYAILQQRLFKYKPILIMIVITLLCVLKNIFEHIPWMNYIDILLFIVLAIMCKRRWYRAIVGGILSFTFTLISSAIKSMWIPNIDFTTISSLVACVIYIDVYLMAYIYYLYEIRRKEINHGRLVSLVQIYQKVENYFSSVGKSISSVFRRNRSTSNNVIFDTYCGIIFGAITYFSLLIIGIIFNRWIEMTISAISFHVFRGDEDDTYHAENDIKCWCVSMVSFGIDMKLTLPIYMSFIVSVGLAFILCVIMRMVYRPKNKRDILIKIFNNQSEEDIERMCITHGLLPKYSETVYLYLNNTLEETASILNIDAKTVTRRINKVIKELS